MEEVLMPFPRPDKTPPVTMTYFTSNHGIGPSSGSEINFVSRILEEIRTDTVARKSFNGLPLSRPRDANGTDTVPRSPARVPGPGLLPAWSGRKDAFPRFLQGQTDSRHRLLVQPLSLRARVGRPHDRGPEGIRRKRRPVRHDQRERRRELSRGRFRAHG